MVEIIITLFSLSLSNKRQKRNNTDRKKKEMNWGKKTCVSGKC